MFFLAPSSIFLKTFQITLWGSREKISIPGTLPFVTLSGDASDPPTITGNDTASVSGSDGMPLGTFHSATVAVDANYFVAINMKFEVKQQVYI